MRTGTVKITATIQALLNRLKIAPDNQRPNVVAELLAAIDHPETPTEAVAMLRQVLSWQEVRDNPVAAMRMAKIIRITRNAENI